MSVTKSKFKFLIQFLRVDGSALTEITKSDSPTQYRIGWSCGETDCNKGTTAWVAPVSAGLEFKHYVTVTTVLVKKNGTHVPKPLRCIVEEDPKAPHKVFEWTIDLVQSITGDDARYHVQEATGKTVRLHLMIVSKHLSEAKVDDDEISNVVSDVENERDLKAKPLIHLKQATPAVMTKRNSVPTTQSVEASTASVEATIPVPPQPEVQQTRQAPSVEPPGGDALPSSLTILRLAGQGLDALRGQFFRIGCKQGKEKAYFTDFAQCRDSTVVWNEPTVFLLTGDRIKFSVQKRGAMTEGPEAPMQEVLAFVADPVKFPVDEKEFAFTLKIADLPAKLHLAATTSHELAGAVDATPGGLTTIAPSPRGPSLPNVPESSTPTGSPTGPPKVTPKGPPHVLLAAVQAIGFVVGTHTAAAAASNRALPRGPPLPNVLQSSMHSPLTTVQPPDMIPRERPPAMQEPTSPPSQTRSRTVVSPPQNSQADINQRLVEENHSLKQDILAITEEADTLRQKLSMTLSIRDELQKVRSENTQLQQAAVQAVGFVEGAHKVVAAASNRALPRGPPLPNELHSAVQQTRQTRSVEPQERGVPPSSLTILRLVGKFLDTFSGEFLRIAYKQGKEKAHFTDFAQCRDSTVVWNEPMVFLPTGGKIKFSVQKRGAMTEGPESPVLAFVADPVKLYPSDTKKLAFELKIGGVPAKLYLERKVHKIVNNDSASNTGAADLLLDTKLNSLSKGQTHQTQESHAVRTPTPLSKVEAPPRSPTRWRSPVPPPPQISQQTRQPVSTPDNVLLIEGPHITHTAPPIQGEESLQIQYSEPLQQQVSSSLIEARKKPVKSPGKTKLLHAEEERFINRSSPSRVVIPQKHKLRRPISSSRLGQNLNTSPNLTKGGVASPGTDSLLPTQGIEKGRHSNRSPIRTELSTRLYPPIPSPRVSDAVLRRLIEERELEAQKDDLTFRPRTNVSDDTSPRRFDREYIRRLSQRQRDHAAYEQRRQKIEVAGCTFHPNLSHSPDHVHATLSRLLDGLNLEEPEESLSPKRAVTSERLTKERIEQLSQPRNKYAHYEEVRRKREMAECTFTPKLTPRARSPQPSPRSVSSAFVRREAESAQVE